MLQKGKVKKTIRLSCENVLDIPVLPGPKPVRPMPIPLPQMRLDSLSHASTLRLEHLWN
jgi:hypothetical protein